MPVHFIYPIYTAVLALALVAVVPKEQMREQAIHAITFGGVGSVVMVFIYSPFNAFEWMNKGPFGYGNIAFFPPLAWTIYFIIYFYLLPRKKPWIYLFVLFAACYSTLFSNVLMNLEIFRWNKGRLLLPFFLYLSWFAVVTWLYTKVHPVKQE